MSLGRGLQRWQQAYADAVRQSLESVAEKRQNMLQTDSPVHFAEVQRDLYVDLVSNTVQASTKLLELAGQIVQDSMRRCGNGRTLALKVAGTGRAERSPGIRSSFSWRKGSVVGPPRWRHRQWHHLLGEIRRAMRPEPALALVRAMAPVAEVG